MKDKFSMNRINEESLGGDEYLLMGTSDWKDSGRISGPRVPWRAAGARDGDAPPEERRGKRRSCRQSKHDREGRRNWFGCVWRGSCPAPS